MPDYGTAGNALAKTNPLLGGLASPGEAATDEADTGGGEEKFRDSPAVRNVLGDRKARTDALLTRIRTTEERSDALQPPTMVEPPKPPSVQATPPAERWGSLAMSLAAMGGLLTRQPLTASLNAMAGVNHAFSEGDAAAAKSAFDTWKIQNDNAIKINEFQNKAYEHALSKISSDYSGAVAESRVLAASFKDDMALALFNSGRPDDAFRLMGGRGALTGKLTAAGQTLSLRQQDMTDFQHSFAAANGRPPNAQELLKHWNEQPKETDGPPKPESAAAAGEDDTKTLAVDRFKKTHDGRAPGPDDAPEMADLRRTLRGEGKTEGKPDQYSAPQVIKVTDEDGSTREVLAQQDKQTSQWFTADETRTPIKSTAGTMRIVKAAPTLSALDATEVQRLMRDEGLSESEAHERVRSRPVSASTAAEKDAETRALTKFKEEHEGRAPGPDDEGAMAVLRAGFRIQARTGDVPAANDPNVEKVAREIAEYKLPPLSGFVLKSPFGQAVMARIGDINPDYSAPEYGARSKATRDFSTGPQGNAIRSFNVAISHLDTLGQLSQALRNNDLQLLNRMGNAVSQWTGGTAPTNFEAARQIVSQEIVKAIIAGGGGVTERQEAEEKISRVQTPEQLSGVISTYKQLMGGQLRGLKLQYEQTTGRTNFDERLSPEARQQLGEGKHAVVMVTSQDEYNNLPSSAWWRKPSDPIDSHRIKR